MPFLNLSWTACSCHPAILGNASLIEIGSLRVSHILSIYKSYNIIYCKTTSFIIYPQLCRESRKRACARYCGVAAVSGHRVDAEDVVG